MFPDVNKKVGVAGQTTPLSCAEVGDSRIVWGW